MGTLRVVDWGEAQECSGRQKEKQKSAMKQKLREEGIKKEGLVNWDRVLGMLRKRKTGRSNVEGMEP